jgi:hypothetical protein
VWARADRGGERKLAGVMWRQGGPVVEEVRARVVDFTALARWFGFQPVGVAGGFPRRYGLANWWHFQCEDALVPLASQLGTELLSLRRYAEDDLRAAGVWDRRTDRLVLDRDRASWRFGAAGPAIAPELSARYYRVVADEIRRALAEYQAIPIALPARDPLGAPAPTPAPSSAEVGVRAPYWINARADAAARAAEVEAAPPELRRVFKAAPVAARLGKGTPDEIRATVQAAVATGQVRARGGVWPPTAADVERWMATFGLGIDCSGFVYETLRRVERALAPRALDGLAVPAIGPSHLFGSGRAAEGYPVTRPSDLNVGDLMHLPPWPKDPIGHVRIVDSVALEGGALVFTTAEATAAGTGGATAVRWRFPDAATMARLERHADGRWRSANEREQRTAGFYRHLPLMRAGLSTIA